MFHFTNYLYNIIIHNYIYILQRRMVHLFYSLYNFRLSCFVKVYEYFKLQTNIDTNYIIAIMH